MEIAAILSTPVAWIEKEKVCQDLFWTMSSCKKEVKSIRDGQIDGVFYTTKNGAKPDRQGSFVGIDIGVSISQIVHDDYISGQCSNL